MSKQEKHANVSIFVPHLGCPHQCSFCNQRSISGSQRAPSPQEVKAICTQALAFLGERAKNSEIAFFGGSFTAIAPHQMRSLLEAAFPFVGSEQGKFRGIRLSTRPDAVGEEVLEELKRYGVTSIELGVQSMDDEVLLQNQRGHTAQDVVQAAERIHRKGFCLGLQMMVGLWRDSPAKTRLTAQKLAALNPKEVRIYPVAVIRNTLLAEKLEKGEYCPMSLEEAVPLCAELLEFFEGQGIRVIRMGLHASEVLEKDLLGGVYHPAFRELCESERYFQKISRALLDRRLEEKRVDILVNPKEISKALGQKRGNLQRLEKLGYQVRFLQSHEVARGDFEIQEHRAQF